MWPNPQETAYLVTFTEEILNGKFHFSRRVNLFLIPKVTHFSTIIRTKIEWINKQLLVDFNWVYFELK